ncbi:MAG: AAA family ATPase [Bacteroidales bacterium]|jgi:predicted ATPase/signal transduction histidine kinase/tRNA A-37 threonylcarbamoyl transferase component Bud32
MANLIQGYQIKEKLYESYNSAVYRAFKKAKDIPVIIKILNGEYPDPERIARFNREYEILRNLNLEGAIKAYSLESYNNSYAIIMEDFGGESIKEILEKRKLNLNEFLKLSIRISYILGQLHQLNIIHKNINPTNIVWNQETDQVKIIDFGISTVLSREVTGIQNPNEFEGTLSYISPEQTGRMNRMLDYRTDMYSLGVTLYEMMTGQLPFVCNNAMELVHCHIAKDPVPPVELKITKGHEEQETMEILSSIILKLMAKNAEERYQSAFGLNADLENCLEQLHTGGKIKNFPIAKKDFSNRFQIPQKLYGREKEIEILLNSFNRVCQGTKEMMMVYGYSGIGKSALVNEIHKHVVAKKGYFISGKFEQFKRNIPFFSLIQAFQQLIRQILTESEEQIATWKEEILEAIGPNGRVIIDVIPEVELIIGKQPPVPELPSQESQNRFNLYFTNFIRTFTNVGHPLIIFLDDLQWIDLPSLNLVELFMTDSETKYLFFIGAYRDNEVDNSHPLLIVLNRIQKAQIKINTLSLSSLDFTSINLLLADTLKCSTDKTEELAKLCMKKTNGNPFFLIQFLLTIYGNKLFEFDHKLMVWHWDIYKIEKLKVTDNVVDLMVNEIQKLSEDTQSALKLAACIGNQFDLKTLSMTCEKTPIETANNLWEALQEELILPLSDVYRYIHNDIESAEVCYRFCHDRIQYAAYSLIAEKQRKELHLKIGRMLLSNSREEELEEKIFNITNQLNSGLDLIEEKTEKNELARLNFMAGKKAKAANAYEIAYRYFLLGIDLLGISCWRDQYTLALMMYTEATEGSYLTGDFEKMNDLAKEVIKNSRSLLDRIKINEVIIQSLIARARIEEAVSTAIGILKQLGVYIPEKPKRINVLLSILKLRFILSRYTLDELNALPHMKDEHMLAAMRILMRAASSAYRVQILKVIMMILNMVHLSIKYGNSPFSPYGYSMYGVVSLGVIGNTPQGYQFGKFSFDLISKFNTKEFNANIIAVFNIFIRHWKDKLRETIDPLMAGYQLGLETGDLEFAALSIMMACIHSLYCGTDLELVDKEMGKYIEVVKKLKQERTLYNMQLHRQLALNLRGYAKDNTLFIGDSFNEEEMLPFLIKANDKVTIGTLYTKKTMVCYLFGKRTEALKNALILEKYKEPLVGMIYLPLVYYYTSLVFLYQLSEEPWQRRFYYLRKVFLNQRTMKKYAKNAPENHLHKWHLVEAEKFKVLGKDQKAIVHYNEAIQYAHINGYIQDEALANELAAKYYLIKGNESSARSHMSGARFLYIKWGAKAKVRHLDEEYKDLLSHGSDHIKEKEEFKKTKTIDSDDATIDRIDLEAVLKASQIISGEIHLEKLLEKLLKILIADAGAEKGYILLMDNQKLFIEGEAFANRDKVNVLHHIPFMESNYIAQVVINYVLRTKETLTLDDAVKETIFSYDDYILHNQSKSLFCMPLIYQNKLSGILYLENNLITGAFTSERVEILKMLSGQIVVSIENARLYKNLEEYNRNLEEKVEKRTAEISLKNEQLNIQKEELNTTLDNLKYSQVQLVQSEKMASLGQLVAGIAHEINNPVNFISAGVDSLSNNLEEIRQVIEIYHKITARNVNIKLKEIEELKERVNYKEAIREINKLIDSIKNGAKRTTEIVRGLRTFSRLDEDILKMADIHEGIDSTLILLHNKYKNRIEIVKNYSDLPFIECYPGQLNQVFMNILSNAVDAIDEKGTITISTSISGESVKVSIKDTGYGIHENLKTKIFDPFFTTKGVGKGTGLGLSISQSIIEKHKGTISFKSEQGNGTVFIITLPLSQSFE